MSQLRETARLVREALGSDYGVYAVPEALSYTAKARNHVVMPPDLHSVFSSLIIGFASVVVAGNIYIIVVQQKRKIGLLRVVGAISYNTFLRWLPMFRPLEPFQGLSSATSSIL